RDEEASRLAAVRGLVVFGPAVVREAPRLALPADDLPVRVDSAAEVVHARGLVVLPRVLVPAHPLHPNRDVELTGHDRRVEGGVVRPVLAVRPGALSRDEADVVVGDAPELRDRLTRAVRSLRRRPHRAPVALPDRNGRRRTD